MPRVTTIRDLNSRNSRQNNSNSQNQSQYNYNEDNSMGNGCLAFLRMIPIVTIVSSFTLLGLFIWTAIKGSNFAIDHFGNCPAYVVENKEWWRLFTPGFFHLNVLHIIFNLLASVFISGPIERYIGSLPFLGFIGLFSFVPQVIYTAIFYLISAIMRDKSWLLRCSAGYSAHIFAYLVIFIALLDLRSINFCGCFDIPSVVYPWFLLLITSLMNSSASFVGHLSGILAAYLYIYGFLNYITVPRVLLLKLDKPFKRCFGANRLWSVTPNQMNDNIARKNLSFTKAKFEDHCCTRSLGGDARSSNNDYEDHYHEASSVNSRSGLFQAGSSMPRTGGRVLGSGNDHSMNSGYYQPESNYMNHQIRTVNLALPSSPASTPASTITSQHLDNNLTSPSAPSAPPQSPRDQISSSGPTALAAAERSKRKQRRQNQSTTNTNASEDEGAGFEVRSPGKKKGDYVQLEDDSKV